MDFIYDLGLSVHYLNILVINLVIGFILFIAIRIISGVISNVNAAHELSQKDNQAFGVSVASIMLAVMIMLTGILEGEAHLHLISEGMSVLSFGVLGIFLMMVTKIIFDRIALPKISIKKEIIDGNMAASILDMGNVIATAIIIRSAIMWGGGTGFEALITVISIYILSQLILSIFSFIQLYCYNKRHDQCFQKAIENKNQALAWCFSGNKIGLALAISAAGEFIPYHPYQIEQMLLSWGLLSVIMMILMMVLVKLADKIILYKIDIHTEIEAENNTAIGILQATITICMGLMIFML